MDKDDVNAFVLDPTGRAISRLPQIFWESGEGWAEANHWLLEKATTVGIKIKTVVSLGKHLYSYAVFLENPQEERERLDWRHFPVRLADRAVVQFRGHVIKQIERGSLASTTARARMSALIQFYRHAAAHDFVTPETPMWNEKSVVLPYYDSIGFKRALVRIKTDLSISNRARPGTTLEDGLLPLSESHMTELLKFSSCSQTIEMHLMLTIGFFTGARIETITTLRIEDLEQACPDPSIKNFFLIRVGPPTSVATKFSVEGDLLVPDFLLRALKEYGYSTERLKREAKAAPEYRSVLFLTSRSRPYSGESQRRLMTDLRRDAIRAGLKFMQRFKFHSTRATYGTWLMKLTLAVTTVPAAIEFVKNAMLHKDEATTMRYVRFLEVTKGKQEASAAFSAAFTGLHNRNWDQFSA
ncbi:site-specific integrase [Dechloromonas sp. CZR5]|uniref:tyrosine-type recombinase/integrase n=1 Tax=Dechloromonas sp. CZR5 TaxID=2608630 RepID=UPI00168BEB5B|nr:site-specific integrase [Dechloromonas sp. CZR5]